VALTAYRDDAGSFHTSTTRELPDEIIWVDLLSPTDEEKRLVESRTGVRIPSAADLSEIEASSRLRTEHGTIYLSTPVVAHANTPDPVLSPAGFILSERLLVTVRFTQLPTFDQVAEQIRTDPDLRSGIGVFTALIEAIVDRGADVLERLGARIDECSRAVFRGNSGGPRPSHRTTDAMRHALTTVGELGERLSLARDVLLGVDRIAPFVVDLGHAWIKPEFESRLRAAARDVASLNEYETHLSDKVQFLLDAVLGFINIGQNEIFKVLTIVSVVGIPPTLIASIYGMNFKTMPELDWAWGYPYGLAMIALSAIIPALWFKWKGWF
jgi:magnesium transporter